MKYPNQKTFNILVLIALFVLSGLIYLAFDQIDTQTKVQDSNTNQEIMALQRQAALNESNAQFKQPVVSVSDNVVYLPDIRLKLPLDEQSLSFLYSAREVGNPNKNLDKTYDVASQAFLSAVIEQTTVLSCVPVRFSFEPKPNPFNPHEHSAKPVQLADGRILQIYTYSNNSCDQVWAQSKTVPEKIATAFQKASSY